MRELVRCRPCGYVIREDKLGDVCPACGMPRKVFEPYRERVSSNRLKILALDLHPIAIHLSQTFVGLLPLLIIITKILPDFYNDTLIEVINFGIVVFPFTVIIALCSGLIDGLTRFKTLKTPLLRYKIIASLVMLSTSWVIFLTRTPGEYTYITLLLFGVCFVCGVALGLWGKELLNVILPGTYPMKKGKKKVVKKEE